jgi:hypothetical protein
MDMNPTTDTPNACPHCGAEKQPISNRAGGMSHDGWICGTRRFLPENIRSTLCLVREDWNKVREARLKAEAENARLLEALREIARQEGEWHFGGVPHPLCVIAEKAIQKVMSTETCAYCYSENYACGTTEEEMSKGDIRSPRLYQSDLCREREARQKAEAKVQELDSLLIELKENAQRIGVNRYEQLNKAETEVEKLRRQLKRAIEIAEQSVMFHPSISRFERREELDQIKATLNTTEK